MARSPPPPPRVRVADGLRKEGGRIADLDSGLPQRLKHQRIRLLLWVHIEVVIEGVGEVLPGLVRRTLEKYRNLPKAKL